MNTFEIIESSLGFAEIRSKLLSDCFTPVGRELATGEFFSNRASQIERALALTAEMKYILEYQGGLPALAFDDIREELARIKTHGTPIEIETLQIIAFIIEKMNDLAALFRQNDEKSPLLGTWVSEQQFDRALGKRIGEILDETGEIRSNASERLAEIRKSIVSQRRKIEKNIHSMLKSMKEKGLVDDDANLNMRGGRLVIPVPAAKKRSIKGVILDESATGQTVYIEPIEIFELNNEVQDLEYAEKREIHRILITLADDIRPSTPQLLSNIDFLGEIDFIRGKAKLAMSHQATMPAFSVNNETVLMQARHPVLEESLKRQKKKIVPLDIELRPDQRILIISGPNAGGKSVAMKTVGLMQYMFQCGFLLPAAEGTRMQAFEQILTDIGDQQSIENDLSTYSSHLLNMRRFIETGNAKTLVLIDEFGSGTEPESGGAIAEAVLEILNQKQLYGIVTTHYFNLKMFAANHAGVSNASMLFDNEQLKPLYKLTTGKPGSSFAIEIARSIGLPAEAISDATTKIGQGRIEMEKMVQDLENEKVKLDERRRQIEVGEEFVAELIEKYERLNKSLQEKRAVILVKAENEAKTILQDVNALIEKTIRDIKQEHTEKEKVKALRKDFEEKAASLVKKSEKIIEPLPMKKQEPVEKTIVRPLVVGDRVRLDGSGDVGDVVSIKNSKVKVQFTNAAITVSHDRLTLVPKNNTKPAPSKKKIHVVAEKKEALHTLDFRGMRAEEALTELEKFLDDALLSGVRSFSILHGKGYGILRTVIRKHLNQYKDMLEYKDAALEFGGEGITEVKFV